MAGIVTVGIRFFGECGKTEAMTFTIYDIGYGRIAGVPGGGKPNEDGESGMEDGRGGPRGGSNRIGIVPPASNKVGGVLVWSCHKVPAARAKSVAARQTLPATGCTTTQSDLIQPKN